MPPEPARPPTSSESRSPAGSTLRPRRSSTRGPIPNCSGAGSSRAAPFSVRPRSTSSGTGRRTMPAGCGGRVVVGGGGPCRPAVATLLPLRPRRAPPAAGIHLDVGGDPRARVRRDPRDDAVPRRHRAGADPHWAPRRRDGPRPRAGLEAFRRRPRREDQGPEAGSGDRDTRRKERGAMTKHRTGTRNEWLAERLELLKAEKEHTRKGDELARRRQALPWVRIDKPYRFDTDQGGASLAALFRGGSALLVSP